MSTHVIVSLFASLLLGLVFFGLFCWAVRSGQFDDAEEAKYEIFREPGIPESR